MRLLSIHGALIMETSQDFLNTTNLPKGIYILELLTEEGSKQIEKVLKKQ